MDKSSSRYWTVCIYLALALTTLGVFGQLRNYNFVNYDDPDYVTENRHVQVGLSRDNIIWAFTAGHASNWHPLTWLSHMLDCQLFGTDPAGHHLVNLFFHIANTLLLFAVLKQMTGALWRSGFVAALFALHPLHVESVAWVSERKDVLSTLFWILTMAAYLRYAKHPAPGRYLLVLLTFALGLMAKPMLVTLPFVLLLLDWWPLERFGKAAKSRLALEKVPFFILTTVSSVVTFLVQKTSGAVTKIDSIPLNIRIANAFASYLRYIGKMFWPGKLAIFYPHPGANLSLLHAIAAALVLLVVSVYVIRLTRSHRYLLTGWLWYLGTLIPVIGLVQVGGQAMADRYSYVSLIGLFIIVAFGAADLLKKTRHRKPVLSLSAALVILALMVCTYLQTGHWRNSITLFEHALKVTKDNYLAHNNLGMALYSRGGIDEAIGHYRKALEINRNDAKALNNLGNAFKAKGRVDEAIAHFQLALEIDPGPARVHNNLGIVLASRGRLAEAISHYRKALQLMPDSFEIHNNLGVALQSQGRFDEAINHYRRALKGSSNSAELHNNLALVLATHPNPNMRDPAGAITHAQNAVRLTNHRNIPALRTLATAYAVAGRFDEASITAQKALDLASDAGNTGLANQIRTQLKLYKQQKP